MIEIDKKKHRGTCADYRCDLGKGTGTQHCFAKHGSDRSISLKVCSNCRLWTTTDATYEDLFKIEIEQTYYWWRSEFIRTGHSYAKDRMTDLYSEPTTALNSGAAVTTVKSTVKTPIKKPQQLSIAESLQLLSVIAAMAVAIIWLVIH